MVLAVPFDQELGAATTVDPDAVAVVVPRLAADAVVPAELPLQAHAVPTKAGYVLYW